MAYDFSDLSSNPLEDDLPRPSRTWLEAFKRQLLREDDTESETDERIPRSRICHRPHLLTFEDARDAAEGLRSGIPQIINLTETTPEVAQRFSTFFKASSTSFRATRPISRLRYSSLPLASSRSSRNLTLFYLTLEPNSAGF